MSVVGKITVVRQSWTERKNRPGAYKEQQILQSDATTNAEGTAEVDFEAAKEGYYRVRWFSRDRDGAQPSRVDRE